jgi:hypothetical protein
MVVTVTPNIGLQKPDETELASKWVNTPNILNANNAAIQAAIVLPIVAYTPVLIATTVNPNLGVGTIIGQYQLLPGGFVVGTFTFQPVDPGVAAGTGEYAVSLPFVADPVFHAVGGTTIPTSAIGSNTCIGEGYARDNSSVNTTGTLALDVITLSGVSYARLCPEALSTKTNKLFSSASPFVIATNDNFVGNFCYKKQ